MFDEIGQIHTLAATDPKLRRRDGANMKSWSGLTGPSPLAATDKAHTHVQNFFRHIAHVVFWGCVLGLCLFLSTSWNVAQAQTCTSNQKADVLLLIDESGATNNDKVFRDTLTALIDGFASKIRFGLMTFNNQGYLREAIADNNVTAIKADINAIKGTGPAKLRQAFRDATTYWTQHLLTDTVVKRPRYIFLLTDGGSNDGSPAPEIAALRQLSVGGTLYDIKTYAIGFGNNVSQQELDGWANPGGTQKGYLATDQTGLQTALNNAAQEASSEKCDNIDNDCDGQVDENLTQTCTVPSCGVSGTQTCSQGTWGTCQPDPGQITTEICDGKDNDCNGKIDDIVDLNQPCQDTSRKGECQNGVWVCSGSQKVCQATTQPTTEICDGKDNNCDGQIDEQLQQVCYTGTPGTQGQGECRSGTQVCQGGQWATCQGEVKPQTEVCDGKDNDCDGQIDEGCACKSGETRPCGSTTGECKQGVQTCDLQGLWGVCAGEVKPQPEVCDGKDNDCNGKIDDLSDLGKPCTDPSRLGICQAGAWACINNLKICQSSIQPTTEICDGKDNDCNGKIDDGLTSPPCALQNGVCAGSKKRCGGSQGWLECTAQDYASHSSVYETKETRCDAQDNDCNGQIDENLTRPCQTTCGSGQEVCRAGQWGVCSASTPKPEICDGLDNDCNGQIDDGNPGGGQVCQVAGQQGECAKGTTLCAGGQLTCKQVNMPSPEICGDGKDNNCDGTVDENCICTPGATQACGTSNVGSCRKGTQTCQNNGQWGNCVGEVLPSPEICDGEDNDCNGKIDDIPDAGQACTDLGRKGVCQQGVWACTNNNKVCQQNVQPTSEICDGKDNDCNGQIDDNLQAPLCDKQQGVCAGSRKTCGGTQGWLACTDQDYLKHHTAYQSKETRCDNLDNDCNGQIDEPFATKGTSCSTSQGSCQQSGTFVCKTDGSDVICDAKPPIPQPEICDGKDNDCNGKIDDNLQRTCYTGPAGTAGVGLCRSGVQTCTNGTWSNCQGETLPQTETCDNADNDCNGKIDETFPNLGQSCTAGTGICRRTGVFVCRKDRTGTECSVSAGTPAPAEICQNGLDDNCNGQIDEGCSPSSCKDGETRACYSGSPGTAGQGVCRQGTQTCKTGQWGACQGEVAPTSEICDNLDNDCNGKIDDQLERACNTVCGKGIETCTAGQWGSCSAPKSVPEICGNQKDDNCDGLIDEGCQGSCKDGESRPCYTGPAGTMNQGTCRAGTLTCTGGSWGTCQGEIKPTQEVCDGIDNDCNGSVDEGLSRPCQTACGSGQETCINGSYRNCTAPQPQPEICDGLDNDCNGTIDDGCTCKDGDARPCYTGPTGTSGVGECRTGIQRCVKGKWNEQTCDNQVLPTQELCGDQKDNDCNGQIDENCAVCKNGDTRPCPTPCSKGQQTCQNGTWGACSDSAPVPAEICDGIDNDCDGQIDENLLRACKTPCGPGIEQCTQGKWSACLGRQPSPEVCDGLDNDCNGQIDDGSSCPGGVSCTDGVCPRQCRNGECLGREVCREGLCYPRQTCSQITCPTGQTCRGGECVSTCSLLSCPQGLVCWQGQCILPDCYGLGCPRGKVCQHGVCVDDPCLGLSCPQGQFCKAGRCVTTCDSVSCPTGEFCIDGRCSKDPCANITCPQGSLCQQGICRIDPCPSLSCPAGRICVLGECQDDPCAVVRCQQNWVCRNGQCVDACKNKSCNNNTACFQGECVPNDCYHLGCPTGQVCTQGQCVADPCQKVSCATNAFCRNGQCVPSCVAVKCQGSEQCVDGSCVPDPCHGISCEDGKICHKGQCVSDPCKTITCAKGRVCSRNSGQCEEDPCLLVRCSQGACEEGQCVDSCKTVECPAPFVCVAGICTQNDCYYQGCPAGQVCLKSQCVPVPCAGVSCSAREFCRDGQCYKSCVGVSCAEGETCQDGACRKDPCAKVSCSAGQVCIDGNCETDRCQDIVCGNQRVCDVRTGKCIDHPCATVVCPDQQICQQGQCLAKEPPLPPKSDEKSSGDAGETHTDSVVSPPPGCGCSSDQPDPAWMWLWLGMILLLGTGWARHRRTSVL